MENKEIAQIKFDSSNPTTLNLRLLEHWVVWQYPKKKSEGYCGAVHPPMEKYGWIPAIILPQQNEVEIYGHLAETFETPEKAAEHFLGNGRSKGKK